MEPKRNDWVSQVYKDIDELQIQMTEEQIGAMPKQMFKNLVKKQIYKFAFQCLETRKMDIKRISILFMISCKWKSI